jgi:uncharacterized membrane protein
MRRSDDLAKPRPTRRTIGIHYDGEAFGEFSEAIARFLGTARFLVWQTGVIAVWVVWNAIVPKHLRFDPFPFQFLTLVLSLQASYAAPLILLAQNRQEARDRTTAERDREITARTQADTEFLAREIASVRLALSDMATGSDIAELAKAVERLTDRIDALTDG